MAAVLTDIGEEYVLKNNLDAASLTVGLYNDATDTAGDTTDLADLTTEPSDGNYVRQSMTAELVDNTSQNWQFQNNAQISFDVTDTTGTVDSYFIVANFTSTDASDGSATDHIIATGALSQSRDLSQIDTLNLAGGSVGASLD